MRGIITRLAEDVIGRARLAFERGRYVWADDIGLAGEAFVGFSPAIAEADRAIKAFLYPNMYRAPRVMKIRAEATEVVANLFRRLFHDIATLPPEWQQGLQGAGEGPRARRAAEYIAGMTDNFALGEHQRVF